MLNSVNQSEGTIEQNTAGKNREGDHANVVDCSEAEDHHPLEEETRPALPVDETDDDLCRALWLSVILQALTDARSKSAKRCKKLDRLRALQWIAGADDPDSDFARVCEFAGVDRLKMKRRIDSILAESSESVDFRVLKKMKQEQRSWEDRSKFLRRTQRRKERLLRKRLAEAKRLDDAEADKAMQASHPPGNKEQVQPSEGSNT